VTTAGRQAILGTDAINFTDTHKPIINNQTTIRILKMDIAVTIRISGITKAKVL